MASPDRAPDVPFRALAEFIPNGLLVLDDEMRITYANAAFSAMLGYPRDEVTGRSIGDVLKSPAVADLGAQLERLLAGEQHVSEALLIHHDRSHVLAALRITPVIGPDGRGVGALALVIRGSARRAERLLDVLRTNDRGFRDLFQASPVGLQIYDGDGNLIDANPASFELLGVTEMEQIQGVRLFSDLKMPDADRRSLREGKMARFDTVYHLPRMRVHDLGGQPEWVPCHVHVLVSPVCQRGLLPPVAYFVHVQDTTDHRKAEQALKERTHALGERVKELYCLFGISKIIERSELSLEQVVQGIVDLVPAACQYPEVACAQVVFDARAFRSSGFAQSHWNLSQPVQVYGRSVGSVEVCYLEERPAEADGPFLQEERELVAVVAERLGRVIERKRSEEMLRQLSQQVMKAQEVERQRLAFDLHDSLAQDLSILKIGLETLRMEMVGDPPERVEKVTQLTRMVQRNIGAVRDMSYTLHPASLKQLGVVHTIRRHCEDFASTHGVPVEFLSIGIEDLDLDFDAQIALFRLVQEGLTNVAKHARAQHATVKLSASFPYIILRIEDDGVGFDAGDRMSTTFEVQRMGLRIMEHRVAFLKGEMTLWSKPAHGTKIVIKIPYNETSHAPADTDSHR